MKVLTVFGTRPEAIKMAPVISKLQKCPAIISCTCVTAQHRDMLDQVLAVFEIQPNYDLNIMRPQQSLAYITQKIMSSIEKLLIKETPDCVLVQGDTTTTMATTLAAFYRRVPVAHIEAGLRTFNNYNPFPEEVNRKITDLIAALHFAPTETAKQHLLDEGIPAAAILMTGNTIVDALQYVLSLAAGQKLPVVEIEDKRLIIVTAHRRESFGAPLANICGALAEVAGEYSHAFHFLWVLHPNPNVYYPVSELLYGMPGISLIDPLDYVTFVSLVNRATLILTDSGGILEEAASLGKPVLIMRDYTERTEAIEAGLAKLVGTDKQRLIAAVRESLNNETLFQEKTLPNQIYGDGRASERIVQALVARFG